MNETETQRLDPPMGTITLDLDSLTLGEMTEAERQSGQDFYTMLTRGKATRRLLALFIHELRSSATPRSWHELAARRPLAEISSSSPSSPAGAPPKQGS
jgi:hypothetical protein